jgi:hypothetical protein
MNNRWLVFASSFLCASYLAWATNVNLPTVTIGSVERGESLPFSVAPGKIVEVEVEIDPPADADVTFAIKGGGGQNGSATVEPTSLRKSGTLKVKGGSQTASGTGPQLKIEAKYKGDSVGTSAAFAVCAHPSKIGFGSVSILSPFVFQGRKFWGAAYSPTFECDSGKPEDCSQTKVSEKVSFTTATGWFSESASFTSGFVQTTDLEPDHHAVGGFSSAANMKASMEESGLDGTSVANQYFMFSCARCGIGEAESSPKVQTSGFKITSRMSKDAGAKYYIHVKKEGSANNGVSAGTVSDSSEKTAEVKD